MSTIHCRVAASLAVLALAGSVRAAPYKTEAGPSKVEQRDEDWIDKARADRVVPVRIYLPSDVAAPTPLIVLSHGLGGTRAMSAFAATHWASHGYTVVALQHRGSDEGVLRGPRNQQERLAAMRAAANADNAILRCGDVRFALDRVTALCAIDGPLAGKVDLNRIGMAGHSFGAQTTQAIMGQRMGLPAFLLPSRGDDRVKAAVAFSPGYNRGQAEWAFADVKIPCLHYTGTEDVAARVSDMTVAQRRVPFDHIRADGQRLVVLNGGDHMVFSGRSLPATDTAKYARFHDLIRQSTTAFWDAELKGDAAAANWLDHDFKDEMGDDGSFETHGK